MNEYETKIQIIGFFRDNEGDFVSGEDISYALGVSLACVWKYIDKLRDEGYGIEAVSRRGYKLQSVPDKMYGYNISSRLNTQVIGQKEIYHFEKIDSTNNKAYELAEKGATEGTIVIAETQTHGKGRMGRKWVSPSRGGIYMSLILRPDSEMDEIPSITIITAVSIINAIDKICGIKTGMKWPNDILVNRRKVCGILTEIKAQPDMVDFLVLGMGINVNTSSKELPPEGTSLKIEKGFDVSRIEVIRSVLEEFEKNYIKFKEKGFVSLREECKSLSLVLGKRIRIKEYHKIIDGIAEDIDEKGTLILNTDNGLKRIFSGDVCF